MEATATCAAIQAEHGMQLRFSSMAQEVIASIAVGFNSMSTYVPCRNGSVHAPRLVARSHPLPLTEAEGIVLDVFLEILAALFLLVPLCFLAAAYCINPGVFTPPGSTI